MINILLITEHFPPEVTAGSNRPKSLFKYLKQHDINAIVITKKFYNSLQNESNVFYVDSFINWRETPLFSYKRIMRILNLPYRKFCSIFNDYWWSQKAYKEAVKIIKGYDVKLVYATFPGAEAIKLGLKIQQKSNLPLITEFRDGLVFESILINPNWLQRKLSKKLEQDCANQSNAIITIGENLSAHFTGNYSTPVYTIYNGYDSDDFIGIDSIKNAPNQAALKTRIVFFGELNSDALKGRLGIFEAIKQLKLEGILSNSNFELAFIGKALANEKAIVEKNGISDVITFYSPVSKNEGFKKIKNEFSHLLLYGVEGHSTVVTSKLLEYLLLGKPVLGICKRNEAELIISQTGIGEVCDFDVLSIKSLLVKSINGDVHYKPNYDVIEKFDREYQANEVASIIKSIIV